MDDQAKTLLAMLPDPKKYIKLCLRSWRLYLISVLAFLGLAGFYLWYKTPGYMVESQLMLKDDVTSGGMLSKLSGFGDFFNMGSSTDNEVMVMQSHSVLRQTAMDLNMDVTFYNREKLVKWIPVYYDAPLRLQTPVGIADTLSRAIDFKIHRRTDGNVDVTVKTKRKTLLKVENRSLPVQLDTSYGLFTLEKTDTWPNWPDDNMKIRLLSYDAVAEGLAKTIQIYAPSRKTDFITLDYLTPDAKFGKELLSRIIDNYYDLSNNERIRRTGMSLDLVNSRLAQIEKEMALNEQQIEQFKRENNLTDVEADTKLLLAKMGEIESTRIKLETETEILKLTLDFINDESNTYSLIPDLISNASLSSTPSSNAASQIAAYNELILERMRIAATAREGNASIRQLDQQIEALRKNIIVSVNRAYDNSKLALNEIRRENSKLDHQRGTVPSLEREYITLRRNAEIQNEIYAFLLQQKEEFNFTIDTRSFPAMIIDQPHTLVQAQGITPMMLVAIALFFGLMLPAVYLYFIRMKSAPASDEELRRHANMPVVGGLAKNTDNSGKPEILSNNSVNSDALRRLRSEVALLLNECDGKVVTVTSANDAEGKSYVAVNLALSMAMLGKRTLLIDANMRDSYVANALGLKTTTTLSDYVNGTADVDIQSVAVGGGNALDVITTETTSSHPADIIGSTRMHQLIESLRERYEVIVIDSSSLKYSDTYYWADCTDLTLVVARSQTSSITDINMVNGLMSAGRLPRIALVTNAQPTGQRL